MAACDTRTLAALEAALEAAASLGLVDASTPEAATATALKNSLIAEQACRGALGKATAANDADALSKVRIRSVYQSVCPKYTHYSYKCLHKVFYNTDKLSFCSLLLATFEAHELSN